LTPVKGAASSPPRSPMPRSCPYRRRGAHRPSR